VAFFLYISAAQRKVQVEVLEEFYEFFELPQNEEDYEKFKNCCTGVANE